MNQNDTLKALSKAGVKIVKKQKIQKSKSDTIFDTVNYVVLSLMLIIFLYPLIYVVSASFSKPSDVITGAMWLFPTSISLDGYARILSYAPLWQGFLNTIYVVVVGTIISLVITLLAGYVLSRDDFKARKFFIWVFTITMFFGGGLVPTYMLVSETLNLRDSLMALIIPSALSVWNIILVKTYFTSSLPRDIFEAASIDGCGDFRFFISIATPLAIPIIAVITLYNVVGKWNSYFDAMIYLSSADKYPLQLVINNLLIENDVNSLGSSGGSLDIEHQLMVESMKYGVIVIASLPMLVVYPMVQQYFIKGIMVGSVKG
ncbi:MAG: carbohydrate ABC transporter permease [Clostridiales bacterium]|nr:carbohydrate ABC transporter permease [Clostridiales bacterium]